MTQNAASTPVGLYAIVPGNPGTGNPMDLTPAEDPLRNGWFTGTVTAAGFNQTFPPGVSATNTRFGLAALTSVSTGLDNSAFGYTAGQTITTGSNNSIFGAGAAAGVGSALANASIFGANAGAVLASTSGSISLFGFDAGVVYAGVGPFTAFGTSVFPAETTGLRNTGVGHFVGGAQVGQSDNTLIGERVGRLINGSQNTLVGSNVMASAAATQANNTAVGFNALISAVGSNSLALGAFAGKYDVGAGSTFYVNVFDQATTAGDVTNSLMYGVFNVNPALQTLTINATLTLQGGAGLPFLSFTTSPTSGAAASLGTLTNAPAAGNPTKWYPVNDAGVTRYVPLW